MHRSQARRGTTASRLGIDLRPLDLTDPAALAWLEAFVWPEQTGDLATLPGELPGTEPVVVFTASLLSYLTLAERIAFTDQLHQIAERRSLSWIFAETPALWRRPTPAWLLLPARRLTGIPFT